MRNKLAIGLHMISQQRNNTPRKQSKTKLPFGQQSLQGRDPTQNQHTE